MLIDLSAAPTAADDAQGYTYMALGAVGWLTYYAFACWRYPFARCRRCKGTARIQSPTGKTFRICRRCGGSGRRIRIARRIFNYFHAKNSAAK